jgi:hypothetical protein
MPPNGCGRMSAPSRPHRRLRFRSNARRALVAAWQADLARRRSLLARKAGFNPDQPRDELGQWTDTGGGSGGLATDGAAVEASISDIGWALDSGQGSNNAEVTLVADDPPVPLRGIHPDATYETDRIAKQSLDYWRQQPTGTIVDSLKPGGDESLKASPDGRIMNGNTRLKILQERGYDINSLPREVYRPSFINPGRPGGGGGAPGGGGGRSPLRLWPWQ